MYRKNNQKVIGRKSDEREEWNTKINMSICNLKGEGREIRTRKRTRERKKEMGGKEIPSMALKKCAKERNIAK